MLLRTVLHNVTSGIAVFDGKELRLKWANRKYLQVLTERWGDADMTGRPLAEIIPGAAGTGLEEIFRRVACTGVPHFDPEYAHHGLARGTTYWQWSLLPLTGFGDDSSNVMLFLTEITEQVMARKRTEQLSIETEKRSAELHKAYGELETRTRELTTLLDISRQTNLTLDLEPLLDLILQQLKAVTDYTGATIFTATEAGVILAAYHGPVPQQSVVGLNLPAEWVPLYNEIQKTRGPVILDDIQGDGQAALEFRSQGASRPVENHWKQPRIVAGSDHDPGELDRNLQIDHLQPGFFTQRHAQLALAISYHAAVALENSRLYREARKVAALEERARLARELHDSVSQALYAIWPAFSARRSGT